MSTNINWSTVGHVSVGILIAGSQAVALAFPQDVQLVAICHVIALIAAQVGVSLGVWTVSASVALKKQMMAAHCTNCGMPAFAEVTVTPEKAVEPVKAPEPPKAA
jgi:hypothetical protein